MATHASTVNRNPEAAQEKAATAARNSSASRFQQLSLPVKATDHRSCDALRFRIYCDGALYDAAWKVAIALAEFVRTDSKTFRCWPKVETLVAMTHLSKRAVLMGIEDLERLGVLSKHRGTTGRGKNGRHQNIYTFQTEWIATWQPPDQRGQRVKQRLPKVQNLHLGDDSQGADSAPDQGAKSAPCTYREPRTEEPTTSRGVPSDVLEQNKYQHPPSTDVGEEVDFMKPEGRRKRKRQLTLAELDAIEEAAAARRIGSAGYGGTEVGRPRPATPKQRTYMRGLERGTGAEPLPESELTYDRVTDRITELEAEQHDQRRSRTVELRRLEHATRSELETISEARGRLDTSGEPW